MMMMMIQEVRVMQYAEDEDALKSWSKVKYQIQYRLARGQWWELMTCEVIGVMESCDVAGLASRQLGMSGCHWGC